MKKDKHEWSQEQTWAVWLIFGLGLFLGYYIGLGGGWNSLF
jgi:hypothetical protein